MSDLEVSESRDTPGINFRANGYFEMSGRSLPMDADDFYEPVINYLERYTIIGSMLIFDFRITFYNTLSLRYLSKMFSLINVMHRAKKQVLINWYYSTKDETIYEIGRDFKNIYNFKINLISE